MHRRHLSTSQRAMVAARAREYYDRQAKERQKESIEARRGEDGHAKPKVEDLPPVEKAKSRDQAGKAVGVSGKTVDKTTKVLEEAEPELVKAVDEGKVRERQRKKAPMLANSRDEQVFSWERAIPDNLASSPVGLRSKADIGEMVSQRIPEWRYPMAIRDWRDGAIFVDLPGEPKLEKCLRDLTRRVQDQGDRDIIIDFSQVTILNSSCLATLVRLRMQLQERGHRLVLCNIGTATQGILSITGLNRIFEITSNTRDAFAALHDQAPSAAVPQP